MHAVCRAGFLSGQVLKEVPQKASPGGAPQKRLLLDSRWVSWCAKTPLVSISTQAPSSLHKRQQGIRTCSAAAADPGAAKGVEVTGDSPSLVPAASQQEKLTTVGLLLGTWRLFKQHAVPIVLIYMAYDLANLCAKRVAARIVNLIAVHVLRRGISPELIGDVWGLTADPNIANFQTGYQWLVLGAFLLRFPMTLAVKSVADAATYLLCVREPEPATQQGPSRAAAADAPPVAVISASTTDQPTSPAIAAGPAAAAGKPGGPLSVLRSMRRGAREVLEVLPEARAAWRRVFETELQVAVRLAGLLGLSMLIIPLPWTLPRIVDLTLASPVAALEGTPPDLAIQRSKRLVQPVRWTLFAVLAGLLACKQALDPLKELLLTRISPRYYRELPEIPLLALAAVTAASVLLHRLPDLLPLDVYLHRVRGEQSRQEEPAVQAAPS